MKTILCYGDSNTFGSPARPLEAQGYRHPFERRWTSVAQRELGDGYRLIVEGLPGRTTVHDDPVEGIHKNGRATLLPILESHAPLDAIVLMLGTNDLKARFALGPFDIAAGIGTLLKVIRDFSTDYGAVKVLLVCPPPILELGGFAAMFAGGAAKSAQMPHYYREVAQIYGARFLEAGRFVTSSTGDGIHLDEPEHTKLGQVIAAELRAMLD